jgi:hypothetical protein
VKRGERPFAYFGNPTGGNPSLDCGNYRKRRAQIPHEEFVARTPQNPPKQPQPSENMPTLNDNTPQQNPIARAADEARHAMGFREHHTPGFDEPKRIPVPAVASSSMDLSRALKLNATPEGVYGLNIAPAGETTDLDPRSVIEANSRVVTAGDGAEIAGDGSFRAGGVLAELTAATDKTVIGVFNRAAIAFRPELSVHVKRLNANGDSELTVFANAQAVLPNAADFWTVSA